MKGRGYVTEKQVRQLCEWYRDNARELPWRENKDPYRIWVSEIMLQQTRVEAVKPYFARFMKRFPTVEALADGQEEDLLKNWEGLGYYNRVRNMNKAAILVRDQFGGKMPVSYDVLLSLPGIGPYTAGAIASIAGNEKVPAVDGNVLRVVTRLNADLSNISEPATIKAVRETLMRCIPDEPGIFNQALMELGATVCLPNVEPKCEVCPWKETCRAKEQQMIDRIPVKTKAKKRTIEERTILLLSGSAGVALRKRPAKGLLAGMYEPAVMEGAHDEEAVLLYAKELGYHPLHISRVEDHVHVFTHKEWHMRAYRIRIDELSDVRKVDERNDFFFVEADELLTKYPLPSAFAPYRKYLEEIKNGKE